MKNTTPETAIDNGSTTTSERPTPQELWKAWQDAVRQGKKDFTTEDYTGDGDGDEDDD
jgi:hypothetical protein